MSWWHVGNECLRCNNTGFIPVMSYKGHNRLIIYEAVYVCNCQYAKDQTSYREKERTDNNGKREAIRVKITESQRFDDLFSETQFYWDEKMAFAADPHIDYHQVYLAGMLNSVSIFRSTEKPVIISDMDYIKNYIKLHPQYPRKA